VNVGTFPGYIPRAEEQQILRESAMVRQDGRSRVVLLYGPGGVGKTQLVRHLQEVKKANLEDVFINLTGHALRAEN